MDHYILYHAPVSLYSGKARAYLRWKNIAFNEVLCPMPRPKSKIRSVKNARRLTLF